MHLGLGSGGLLWSRGLNVLFWSRLTCISFGVSMSFGITYPKRHVCYLYLKWHAYYLTGPKREQDQRISPWFSWLMGILTLKHIYYNLEVLFFLGQLSSGLGLLTTLIFSPCLANEGVIWWIFMWQIINEQPAWMEFFFFHKLIIISWCLF